MKNIHGINTVQLAEYMKQYEIVPHPYYQHFWSRIPNRPDVTMKVICFCCTRRPITVLEQGRKRLITDNYLCYNHAQQALDHGQSDIAVSLRTVKNIPEPDIYMSILLDVLRACPITKVRPLYRAQMLERAFMRKDLLKNYFKISTSAAFCKVFGAAPSTLTRSKQLDQMERDRLSTGCYKRRGKLKKAIETPKQSDNHPELKSPKQIKSKAQLIRRTSDGNQQELF